MSGPEAAARAMEAEAAEAARVKLAERWVKIPANVALGVTINAVTAEGIWWDKPITLLNGYSERYRNRPLFTTGLCPWLDVMRALGVRE